MRSFEEERQWITNEFEEAVFDTSTGLGAEELYSQLQELQRASAGRPRQLVCAEAYAWLLDHVELVLNLHTPFYAKMNIYCLRTGRNFPPAFGFFYAFLLP